MAKLTLGQAVMYRYRPEWGIGWVREVARLVTVEFPGYKKGDRIYIDVFHQEELTTDV